jgi:hypothetical protein
VSTNEGIKNLVHTQNQNVYRVAELVDYAVTQGNGRAAEEAVTKIDKEFVLVRRADIPPVEINRFTNTYLAGSTPFSAGLEPETYVFRALSNLALADYAKAKKVEHEEKRRTKMRAEAHKLLFPASSTLWSYDDLAPVAKKQIDVVVKLMEQVDELKESK